MTKQSPKILFFGNERLATGVTTTCPTLRALLQAGYNVAAVILHAEAATSRSKRSLEIAELAQANNIPVFYPHKLSTSADGGNSQNSGSLADGVTSGIPGGLAAFKADIGVLVAFGKIIPQSVIDVFPRGIINVHPSLLPKHRGSTPIESVILKGEAETGVSVMRLTSQMDAGPVFAQRAIPVLGHISKQDLANTLSEIGSKMIVQHLPAIIAGELEPQKQDDTHATYDSLIEKSHGQLNWDKSAEALEREIRAYRGWPKSTATIGGHQFIVTQADVIATTIATGTPAGKPGEYTASKKELIVNCGSGALSIKQVQPVNKKEMPIQAFLAGHSL